MIRGLDTTATVKIMNVIVPIIMRRRFTRIERVKIMVVWLTEYNLQISPRASPWFDRWHKTHGKTVRHHREEWINLELRK